MGRTNALPAHRPSDAEPAHAEDAFQAAHDKADAGLHATDAKLRCLVASSIETTVAPRATARSTTCPRTPEARQELPRPWSLLYLEPEPQAEPELERQPPRLSKDVALKTPCIECKTGYDSEELWLALSEGMKRAPEYDVQKAWLRACRESQWEEYIVVLTKQRVTRETMERTCAKCILGFVGRAKEWRWYDEKRKVWVEMA